MNARGFTLVSLVFLLVILAFLGVIILTLSGTQHYTTLMSLRGAQAYHASRSGIEWGVHRAIEQSSCVGSDNFNLTGPGFDGVFTVTVTCSSSAHTEAPSSYTVYTIESFAFSGTYGDRDYVSRRIRVVVTDAP